MAIGGIPPAATRSARAQAPEAGARTGPAGLAVAPVERIAPVGDDDESRRRARAQAALRAVIERHLAVDPASREVVHQVPDETGEPVRIVAEEAAQRLRAYAERMREADAPAEERLERRA
ncbi:MAG TPA: hypothetical protein VM434_06680 [Beijerinckiaceae bacterium]|nr:hypothetical protein [Beijerinckiaceae bacterium]